MWIVEKHCKIDMMFVSCYVFCEYIFKLEVIWHMGKKSCPISPSNRRTIDLYFLLLTWEVGLEVIWVALKLFAGEKWKWTMEIVKPSSCCCHTFSRHPKEISCCSSFSEDSNSYLVLFHFLDMSESLRKTQYSVVEGHFLGYPTQSTCALKWSIQFLGHKIP